MVQDFPAHGRNGYSRLRSEEPSHPVVQECLALDLDAYRSCQRDTLEVFHGTKHDTGWHEGLSKQQHQRYEKNVVVL